MARFPSALLLPALVWASPRHASSSTIVGQEVQTTAVNVHGVALELKDRGAQFPEETSAPHDQHERALHSNTLQLFPSRAYKELPHQMQIEAVEANEHRDLPTHTPSQRVRRRLSSTTVTGYGIEYDDGCLANTYRSLNNDDIDQIDVTASDCSGLSSTVTYTIYRTGSYSYTSGVCVKLVYRATTDSSWTSHADECYTAAELSIPWGWGSSVQRTWTPTAISTASWAQYYVRAMLVDRASSSDWISGTCASGSAGTASSMWRHFVSRACARAHLPSQPSEISPVPALSSSILSTISEHTAVLPSCSISGCTLLSVAGQR